jgi:hypothetical protein
LANQSSRIASEFEMSSYIYNSLKEAVAFLLLLFQASFGIEDENVFGFWVSENGGLL